MERTISLTDEEQKRGKVLNEVLGGKLLQREAAGLLGMSERQFRRLVAAYREEGVASLPHGNCGPHSAVGNQAFS
jgi:transposase